MTRDQHVHDSMRQLSLEMFGKWVHINNLFYAHAFMQISYAQMGEELQSKWCYKGFIQVYTCMAQLW